MGSKTRAWCALGRSARLGGLLLVGGIAACGENPAPNEPTCEDNARVVGRIVDEDGTERFPDYLIQTFPIEWNMEEVLDDTTTTLVEGFYPVRLQIPEDVTSVGITLAAPGARPLLMGISAGDDTFFALSPTQRPLTKANVAWPDAVSVVLPNNEATTVSGRCLEVWVGALDAHVDDPAQMYVTSRRGHGDALNLNFLVSSALDVDDDAILRVAARAARFFEPAFTAGEVSIERVELPPTLSVEEPLEPYLVDLRGELSDRLSVALVESLTVDDDEHFARFFSPGLPGAPFAGLESSVLRLAVGEHRDASGIGLQEDFLGDSLAQAVAQMLGLFPVTEPSGLDADPIGDTPQCLARDFDANDDGVVDAIECADDGADNLMFWSWTPGRALHLTEQQLAALRNHPVVLADGEVR